VRVVSLFNYILLAECGQIHASKSHSTYIARPEVFRNIQRRYIHRSQFRNPAKPQLPKLFSTFSLALKLPQLRLEAISAKASSRFPSIQNRHRPGRQFRAPAIPFRITSHGCIATSASRFHYTILSCPLNFIEPCRPTKLSTHFVPRLTRLPICGKLNVYAAWFLRGCSVTGECPDRHAPGAK